MALEQKLPGITATDDERATVVAGVALFSPAPAELAAFYERVLRLHFDHRVHEDGREHWIAVLDNVHFEIKALRTSDGERTPDALGEESGGVSRSEVSFRVVDVPGTCARAVVMGARSLLKPEEFDWGTFAVLLDLDGNRLALWSPPAVGTTDAAATAEETD